MAPEANSASDCTYLLGRGKVVVSALAEVPRWGT
jgi:hypothetical protein